MILSGIVPLEWLIRFTGQRCIFPFYHTVSDRHLLHISQLYKVRTVKQFESDLDFLLKYYKPMEVADLEKYTTGRIGHEKYFLLTFDDGLREFYEVIAPILLRKGIPAVCFLNSGFIDNKALFFRYKMSLLLHKLLEVGAETSNIANKYLTENNIQIGNDYADLYRITYTEKHILDGLAMCIGLNFDAYLQEERPYMTTQEIQYLSKQGFIFGAHTTDHPMLADVSYCIQYEQVVESMTYVKTHFPSSYRLFSFPFTDAGVSAKLFNALHGGASPLVDYSFGTAGLKQDEYKNHIQRIPMELSNLTAQQVLYRQYIRSVARQVLRRNTVKHPTNIQAK